jgi:hypothetical protein
MLHMDSWYVSDCLIMCCGFTIWIGIDWIAGNNSGTPWTCCPVVLASSDGGLLMHWTGLCTDTHDSSTYTYDTYWHRWHYVWYLLALAALVVRLLVLVLTIYVTGLG